MRMVFQLLDTELKMIDQIASYVLYGTIALGVILFSILLIFVIKGIKYHRQMKSNKKEKNKLIKAYDLKIEQLSQNNKKAEGQVDIQTS